MSTLSYARSLIRPAATPPPTPPQIKPELPGPQKEVSLPNILRYSDDDIASLYAIRDNIKQAGLFGCFYCSRESTTLKTCSGCRSAWYCSVGHQRMDWNEHRSECHSLRVLKNRTYKHSGAVEGRLKTPRTMNKERCLSFAKEASKLVLEVMSADRPMNDKESSEHLDKLCHARSLYFQITDWAKHIHVFDAGFVTAFKRCVFLHTEAFVDRYQYDFPEKCKNMVERNSCRMHRYSRFRGINDLGWDDANMENLFGDIYFSTVGGEETAYVHYNNAIDILRWKEKQLSASYRDDLEKLGMAKRTRMLAIKVLKKKLLPIVCVNPSRTDIVQSLKERLLPVRPKASTGMMDNQEQKGSVASDTALSIPAAPSNVDNKQSCSSTATGSSLYVIRQGHEARQIKHTKTTIQMLAEKIFAAIDPCHNGSVARRRLLLAVETNARVQALLRSDRRLSLLCRVQTLEREFQELDLDHDKNISLAEFVYYANLSSEQVAVADLFALVDPGHSGSVSKKDLVRTIQNSHGILSNEKVISDVGLVRTNDYQKFTELTIDATGKVTAKEVIEFAKLMTAESVVADIFGIIDPEGAGAVTRRTFMEAVASNSEVQRLLRTNKSLSSLAHFKSLRQKIEQLDLDHNGKVTAKELVLFADTLSIESVVKDIFQLIDPEHAGSISPDQLILGITSHDRVKMLLYSDPNLLSLRNINRLNEQLGKPCRDEHKDISISDLIRIARTLRAEGTVRKVFDIIDHNHKGAVPRRAFLRAVQLNTNVQSLLATNRNLTTLRHCKSLERKFRELDLDHDGLMTISELVSYARSMLPPLFNIVRPDPKKAMSPKMIRTQKSIFNEHVTEVDRYRSPPGSPPSPERKKYLREKKKELLPYSDQKLIFGHGNATSPGSGNKRSAYQDEMVVSAYMKPDSGSILRKMMHTMGRLERWEDVDTLFQETMKCYHDVTSRLSLQHERASLYLNIGVSKLRKRASATVKKFIALNTAIETNTGAEKIVLMQSLKNIQHDTSVLLKKTETELKDVIARSRECNEAQIWSRAAAELAKCFLSQGPSEKEKANMVAEIVLSAHLKCGGHCCDTLVAQQILEASHPDELNLLASMEADQVCRYKILPVNFSFDTGKVKHNKFDKDGRKIYQFTPDEGRFHTPFGVEENKIVQKVFDLIDEDHDGFITRRELLIAVELNGNVQKLLKENETLSSLSHAKNLRSKFKELDLDHDGKVTISEMVHFALLLPSPV